MRRLPPCYPGGMSDMARQDKNRPGFRRRQKAAACFGVVFLCAWTGAPAIGAEGTTTTSRVEQLTTELESVRQQIKDFHTQVAEIEQERWRQQHDLEYQDPEAVSLRERIVELEKELLELRRQLNARLATIEGVRDLQRDRKKMFEKLQTLKQTEEAILRELTTARHQEP